MADRPILFSAPMIRALLSHRKTQTRFVIKPQPVIDKSGSWSWEGRNGSFVGSCGTSIKFFPSSAAVHSRIQPGDHLWVRESFWIAERYSYGTTPGGREIDPPPLAYRRGDPVHYAADGNPPNAANRHYGKDGLRNGSFAAPDPYAVWVRKSSIHMPRWASRITLIVTDVRVERLQDISPYDAWHEGVLLDEQDGGPPDAREIDAYRDLWDSINGAGSWSANPFVAAYSFRVILSNIDQIAEAA